MIEKFLTRLSSENKFALAAKVCLFVFAAVVQLLWHSADAQQPTKIPRIGFVSGTGNANNPGPNIEAFRRGLRDLGYIEGKNILIEYRYMEGIMDRTPSFVAELVQTQGRYPCLSSCISDPRRQAGEQHDSSCHGD